MNAIVWKSPDVSFVECLRYDGHHVGTRTIFKDGRSITDALYPEIQAIVVTSAGFISWLQERRLTCHERNLSEVEYREIRNLEPEPLHVEDLLTEITIY